MSGTGTNYFAPAATSSHSLISLCGVTSRYQTTPNLYKYLLMANGLMLVTYIIILLAIVCLYTSAGILRSKTSASVLNDL